MTTRNFDVLRLGVGLAHMVRRAEIRLSTPNTPDLIASMHPSSDLSICDVREAVAYSGCPYRLDMSRWISVAEIGGSLQTCGGGIYRLHGAEPEQRWFATLLSPDDVIDVLTRLEYEEPLSGGVDANLLPDGALGMTAVCISTHDSFIDIDEVAVILHGACLVSELLEQSARAIPEFDQSHIHPTNTKESNQ